MTKMIDQTVKFGKDIHLGDYVVIEKGVVIGNDVSIGNHVIIKEGTVIGDGVSIDDFTLVGKLPAKSKGMARQPNLKLSPLIIDRHVNIGSHTIIYRGTVIYEGVLIGDLASVRENVSIGVNSIVGRNAMVENNTRIGKNVTIQTSAYVTADMIIEDEVFIGPCFSSSNDKYMGTGKVKLKGPTLKKGAKIGNNASLLPEVVIGEGAIVGAGAVVTKDIAGGLTAVGNPAKKIND